MPTDSAATPTRTRSLRRPDLLIVFVLAAAVRLGLVATSSGGFRGNFGYDPSVYFAASDALIHGRAPYADFVLLHPPGLMLVLTPFVALGQLVGDYTAFVSVNVVFALLGAVNATLIARIARGWGLSRGAALSGGLFYAVWLSAAAPELGMRLEPLGTFAFLCGVLLMTRNTTRATVVAGAAFGAAATVKIWWIVPVLVVLVWHAVAPSQRRRAGLIAAGAAGALLVVMGPFFVISPGPMWRMLVSDQFGRNTVHGSKAVRLFTLSGLRQLGNGHDARLVGVALVVVVGIVVLIAAWRQRAARPYILVALAQVAVLLTSPSYFGFYSGYAAPGVALVVAAAAHRSALRRPLTLVPQLAVLGAVVITVNAFATTPRVYTPRRLDVGNLAADVRHEHCVIADTPMALIALDTLSRGLDHGCPNWVDVTGKTYDVDAAPSGSRVGRAGNQRWQRDVLRYLLSGDAVVVIRSQTGLSPATANEIARLPVIGRAGTTVVHRVPR